MCTYYEVLEISWPMLSWSYDIFNPSETGPCSFVAWRLKCPSNTFMKTTEAWAHQRKLWVKLSNFHSNVADTICSCQLHNKSGLGLVIRADSRFEPSQCETSLQSNVVSHWLGRISPVFWRGASYVSNHYMYICWRNKLTSMLLLYRDRDCTTSKWLYFNYLVYYIYWVVSCSLVER